MDHAGHRRGKPGGVDRVRLPRLFGCAEDQLLRQARDARELLDRLREPLHVAVQGVHSPSLRVGFGDGEERLVVLERTRQLAAADARDRHQQRDR